MSENGSRRGPQRAARVVLFFVVCAAVFLDYWAYSRAFYAHPEVWTDVLTGTAPAPNQYRVGVVYLADFLARHGHVALRHTLTLLDGAAGVVAVFVLFSLLRRSDTYRTAEPAKQWFGAAAFVVLVQFYLAWLLWYQRPETLPTAMLLALALWLLTVRLPGAALPSALLTVAGLAALAVAQGFVRADVVFSLHVGLFLMCAAGKLRGLSISRGVALGASFLCGLIAVAIQYYLMRIVYPKATYGDTALFQLPMNLTSPSLWVPFVLFVMPWAWTMWRVMKRRQNTAAPGLTVAAGSTVFMGLWFLFGRIEEVRIFMPFALTLAPLSAEMAMEWFMA